MREVSTTCPYCGVGCGVNAQVEGSRLIGVSGDPTHPANAGRLCVKGASLPRTQHSTGRLLHPRVAGRRVSWNEAVSRVANGFIETVNRYGPESVAFYLSGQLLTEDYYVANKLMKGFIGSPNVDTNSRLCMSSAVAAHKRAFGEDVVPCQYKDIDVAELIVLVGSNAAWAHPVVYQKITAAVAERGARVVVIDPRRTATCDIAAEHLAIRPGSDIALFNGLLNYIDSHGYTNHAYVQRSTTGFDSARASASLGSGELESMTGLPAGQLERFYSMFCRTSKVVTLFSQGINQSVEGTDKGNAIINCHLATGKIGRSGAGPFSLTGQPNAMGGREVGGMANQLAAHMEIEPEACNRVARFWNAPNMISRPGTRAVEMFEKIAAGKIRAIWIMATNPAVSMPDSEGVAGALRKCPLVVVSDTTADTDTTALADVLLPACGWGEKDGTVTNSERCISRQRAFLPAVGEARPDWQIICEVARAMGFSSAFNYAGVHEIFSEHAALSGFENEGERLFDISHRSGLGASDYDRLEPFTWPAGRRPYGNGIFPTEDGRARLVTVAASPAVPDPGKLVLNTGRLRDQWHTMTRTGNAAHLFTHQAHPWLEVAAADAASLDIETGDLVSLSGRVKGRAVRLHLPSRVTDAVMPGSLFLPMHWNHQYSSAGSVNRLVEARTDPHSGQPGLKLTDVELKKSSVAMWLRVTSRRRLPHTLLASDEVAFWSQVPVEGGFACDVAQTTADLAEMVRSLHGLHGSGTHFEYVDGLSGDRRLLGESGGSISWQLECHGKLSQDSLQGLSESAGWRGLTSSADGSKDLSPRICTCFEVTQSAIREAIDAGVSTVGQLGRELRCGTNCGSCVPELNRLLRENTMTNRERDVA